MGKRVEIRTSQVDIVADTLVSVLSVVRACQQLLQAAERSLKGLLQVEERPLLMLEEGPDEELER